MATPETTENILMKSKFNVGNLIISIILLYFATVVQGVLIFLVGLIPLIGWIIAFVWLLALVAQVVYFTLAIIKFILSKAILTDTGIQGKNDSFRSFSFTFDQIAKLEPKRRCLLIHVNDPTAKKGVRVYRVNNITNENEFYAAYVQKTATFEKAAPATEA